MVATLIDVLLLSVMAFHGGFSVSSSVNWNPRVEFIALYRSIVL